MSAMTRSPSIKGMLRGAGGGAPAPLDAAQPQPEARAAVAGSLESHRAAVRFRDILHDREPEPGTGKVPRVIRAPEPVEDPRRVLRGDARTVIAHRARASRDAHLDERARWAPLRGVVEKVRDRARDADLRSVDGGRTRGHREAHFRVAHLHIVNDLRDDLVEPELLERHRRLFVAGDLDEIADEGGEPLHLHHEVPEQLLTLGGVRGLAALEELEIGPQSGERGAELMRRVGDELPLGTERRFELSEHRVEARAEAAELVTAARGDTA